MQVRRVLPTLGICALVALVAVAVFVAVWRPVGHDSASAVAPVDLTGTWSTTTFITAGPGAGGPGDSCTGVVTQVGSTLSGITNCPSFGSGTFAGTVTGSKVMSMTTFVGYTTNGQGTIISPNQVVGTWFDSDGRSGTFKSIRTSALPLKAPVPYFCPVTQNLAFPDTGCDAYQADGQLLVNITDPASVSLKCNVRGPITVARFQNPLTPNDTDQDGLRDMETELLSMELTGICDPGGFEIIVRQSQANASTGLIEEQTTTESFFPADSFFDVFFEVESITLGRTLHNSASVRLECILTAIPTESCDFVLNLGGGGGAAGAGCAILSGIVQVGNCTAVTLSSGVTDSDLDGCSDAAELQTAPGSEITGGLRDDRNQWDFFDVGDVNGYASTTGAKDGFVDLFNDIILTIQAFSNYNVSADRGPSAGPHPWSMTAPDGIVDLFNDIVGVINQFGHDCR